MSDLQKHISKRKKTDKEFERQLSEAKKKYVSEPEAIAARYENGRVCVEMASGWNFSFNPRDFDELVLLTKPIWKQSGFGDNIRWRVRRWMCISESARLSCS
jgi:hypothetical protein